MADSERLDPEACIELMATVAIGRVAWAEHGRVTVEPVNFVFHEGSVLFRTAEGGKLDAARRRVPFAFEADDAEPALRAGWSVLVRGPGDVVSGSGQAQETEMPVVASPWDESTEKPFLVRIQAEEVTGRRLRPRGRGVVRVTPDGAE